MRLFRTIWARTVAAAALSGAVWLVASRNGYAPEMIWLPAVGIGAAGPRSSRKPCVRRPRKRGA